MKQDRGRSIAWLCVMVCLMPLACARPNRAAPEKRSAAEPKVEIKDIEVGSGKTVENGDWIEIHYTGWLPDGTKFQDSVAQQAPFSFQVGAHTTIKGFSPAVMDMKEGGKRRVTIPADLAYGKAGSPARRQGDVGIPPDTALTFEIVVLRVQK